jgi:hypothetical protein
MLNFVLGHYNRIVVKDDVQIKTILAITSAITFITYGLLCIFTGHMREEFKRYNLERYRVLTGFLELLGGIGTLIGLRSNPIYYISTTGLATLMLLGLFVRIKLKDPVIEMLPALILMLVNIYLLT